MVFVQVEFLLFSSAVCWEPRIRRIHHCCRCIGVTQRPPLAMRPKLRCSGRDCCSEPSKLLLCSEHQCDFRKLFAAWPVVPVLSATSHGDDLCLRVWAWQAVPTATSDHHRRPQTSARTEERLRSECHFLLPPGIPFESP